MSQLNESNIQNEASSAQNMSNERYCEQGTGKTGCWSEEQQKKYIQFLSFSRKQLQSRHQRKNNKVFKLMSKHIGSRDGIQCRSHHVKQLRTHKQISKIIEWARANWSIDELKNAAAHFPVNSCSQNCQDPRRTLIENGVQAAKNIQEINFISSPSFCSAFSVCSEEFEYVPQPYQPECQQFFVFFLSNQQVLPCFNFPL